jgi:hypothetical protein
MGKVNALLTQRLKKVDAPSKMAAMARQSASGQLTSFSGMFAVSDLNDSEKSKIEEILKCYAIDIDNVEEDLSSLIAITSEVKAINNQAALLHGERIKKAHNILVQYRDGAFSAWLMTAYGNRQTPYNLMQYYEFCEAMPKKLRPQIEAMPRQAIYTLATRDVPLDEKQAFVESYQGQTKAVILALIRQTFPLEEQDKRKQNHAEIAIATIKKLKREISQGFSRFTKSQKETIKDLLKEILKEL